jgi:CelD/BcsL family acetyltransferase involved in cellulose biosynthesis
MLELALDDPRWTSFVSSCPDAGPFHNPVWAQLLARCYGFRALALAVRDERGTIEAGAPALELRRSRLVTLPFTDACAPVARSDDALRRFAEGVARTHRVEVRAPLEGAGLVTRVRGVDHVLGLDTRLESIRAGFSSQMRRNIARAERSGVVVRHGEQYADLTDTFYGLHLRTRRRQGVPVQPRRFFRLLWDDLVERGLATLLLAYAEETPVAGAFFLHWNGHTIYKFGASDRAHLALRPNNLIFWEAIREAHHRGDTTFDFGRSDIDNEGLRAFKSGWGAMERPLVYTFSGAAPQHDPHDVALRALGVAIRRTPSWVCRAVGEAAYRYAA